MTNSTAHKFINRNGTFNTKAAMNAGHDARTDGLRTIIKACAIFLKPSLHVVSFKHSLMNLKT